MMRFFEMMLNNCSTKQNRLSFMKIFTLNKTNSLLNYTVRDRLSVILLFFCVHFQSCSNGCPLKTGEPRTSRKNIQLCEKESTPSFKSKLLLIRTKSKIIWSSSGFEIR